MVMSGAADRLEQALEDIRALCDQGWYWSSTTPGLLLSPGDPEVHLWHDGATGDVIYSPKVVEMIRLLLREDEEGF
jgi:hypothetical protein